MFQCAHRHKWRQDFHQHFRQQLQLSKTPPQATLQIHQVVMDLINRPTQQHRFPDFLMFAGLLPLHWQHLHTRESFDSPTAPQKWAKSIGNWLITSGYTLWKQCNEEVHGESTDRSTQEFIINQQITQLYSLEHDVGYQDHKIFSLPLEDLLKKSASYKQQWIEHTRKTIYKCIDNYQQKLKSVFLF